MPYQTVFNVYAMLLNTKCTEYPVIKKILPRVPGLIVEESLHMRSVACSCLSLLLLASKHRNSTSVCLWAHWGAQPVPSTPL